MTGPHIPEDRRSGRCTCGASWPCPHRGILGLDVDGVLHPYAATDAEGRGYVWHSLNGMSVYLSADHGPALTAFANRFGFELVWFTSWEHDANALIAPRAGLPTDLPVVEFRRKFSGAYTAGRWKFPDVLAYAGDRPLIWLDDEFTFEFSHDFHRDDDRRWFLDQRGTAPTLLHSVDPRRGLAPVDLTTITTWATNHADDDPDAP